MILEQVRLGLMELQQLFSNKWEQFILGGTGVILGRADNRANGTAIGNNGTGVKYRTQEYRLIEYTYNCG